MFFISSEEVGQTNNFNMLARLLIHMGASLLDTELVCTASTPTVLLEGLLRSFELPSQPKGRVLNISNKTTSCQLRCLLATQLQCYHGHYWVIYSDAKQLSHIACFVNKSKESRVFHDRTRWMRYDHYPCSELSALTTLDVLLTNDELHHKNGSRIGETKRKWCFKTTSFIK